jgi:hypothetical protein
MSSWLLILAIATFVCVVGFLIWNKQATAHKSQTPNEADPQSSSGHKIRPPEEMRASLDAAANAPRRMIVPNDERVQPVEEPNLVR